MAVGKNKRISKGRKGTKKKLSIPFQEKTGMTSRHQLLSFREMLARLW
jgi:hypothetical protein